MSRAGRRRRIRHLSRQIGEHRDASLAVQARSWNACQRRRAAWHALSLLPPAKRVDALRRALPDLLPSADPETVEAAARAISGRLDRAHENPSVRLRMLRRDVP